MVLQRVLAPFVRPSSKQRWRIPIGLLVGLASDLHDCSGGGGLVRHRGCVNDLLVEHRVWPAKLIGQVWPREHRGHLGPWLLSNRGQSSIEGLANLRLQLSAAGAIMTAAAAEAAR